MIYANPTKAYLSVLESLVDWPENNVSPRDQATRELVDHLFHVERPEATPIVTLDEERNAVIRKYQGEELRLYLTGETRASVWAAQASSFWAKIANPDGKINSNYGQLIWYKLSLPEGRCPWDWARHKLLTDPSTRQAYVRFSLPEHQWDGNKDQVCTMHMNFLIRDDHMQGTVVMRSCDIVKGLVYDMPFFCYLVQRMALDLMLPVGTFGFFCHSLHLYERDLPTALKMLGRKS